MHIKHRSQTDAPLVESAIGTDFESDSAEDTFEMPTLLPVMQEPPLKEEPMYVICIYIDTMVGC